MCTELASRKLVKATHNRAVVQLFGFYCRFHRCAPCHRVVCCMRRWAKSSVGKHEKWNFLIGNSDWVEEQREKRIAINYSKIFPFKAALCWGLSAEKCALFYQRLTTFFPPSILRCCSSLHNVCVPLDPLLSYLAREEKLASKLKKTRTGKKWLLHRHVDMAQPNLCTFRHSFFAGRWRRHRRCSPSSLVFHSTRPAHSSSLSPFHHSSALFPNLNLERSENLKGAARQVGRDGKVESKKKPNNWTE